MSSRGLVIRQLALMKENTRAEAATANIQDKTQISPVAPPSTFSHGNLETESNPDLDQDDTYFYDIFPGESNVILQLPTEFEN